MTALCIRLSGINDPIDSGWYRVALRCSTTDYHFIRQEGSTWYSKSEKLPVFSVTEAEVTGGKSGMLFFQIAKIHMSDTILINPIVGRLSILQSERGGVIEAP